MTNIENKNPENVDSEVIQKKLSEAKNIVDLKNTATKLLADMEKKVNRTLGDIDVDNVDNTFNTKTAQNDFEKTAILIEANSLSDVESIKNQVADLKLATDVIGYFSDPNNNGYDNFETKDDISVQRENIYKLLMSVYMENNKTINASQPSFDELSKYVREPKDILASSQRKTEKMYFMGLIVSINKSSGNNENTRNLYPTAFVKTLPLEDQKIFEYNYMHRSGEHTGQTIVSVYKGIYLTYADDHTADIKSKTMEEFKGMGLRELVSGFDGFVERSGPYVAFKRMIMANIGSQNIFTKLSSEVQNPETLKLLYTKIIVGTLSRNDFDFLKKNLDILPNKADIVANFIETIKKDPDMRKKTLQGIDGVMANFGETFKQHFEEFVGVDQNFAISVLYAMQQAKMSGIDGYIAKYGNNFQAIENNVHTMDALLEKKEIHTLSMYDSGGGQGFFQNEIAKYTKNGSAYELVQHQQKSTISADEEQKIQEFIGYDMYEFREKSTGSTLTFVQYDMDHMSPDVIKNAPGISDKKYDLLACRGHCYSTSEMLAGAQQNNMIDAKSVVIDGGCFNFNKISNYRDQNIQSPIISYNDTGIGNVTNYLFDQIVSNKGSGRKFSELKQDMFNKIGKQEGDDLYSQSSSKQSANTEKEQISYLKNAVKMGSSPYELYLSLNKSSHPDSNTLASNI